MALNAERLKGMQLPATEQAYNERDVLLHALSVGYTPVGTDARELNFVYEKALKVAPSLALTLCHRSIAAMDLGVAYRKVVHAAQAITLYAALPSRATVVSTPRIAEVWDLGERKGALLEIDRELRDRATGKLLATTRMSALCRGDGGFGGAAPPEREPWIVSGSPDHVFKWSTLPIQAALYRLQGDMNPLHIDPESAQAVGFEGPILHGLATFGGCVRALVCSELNFDPLRLQSVEGRFTAPFLPGETLEVAIWRISGGRLAFQARSVERDVVVIREGFAHLVD